jgi:hypothetical protein
VSSDLVDHFFHPWSVRIGGIRQSIPDEIGGERLMSDRASG